MRRFKREDYSRPDYMLQYHDLRNTLFLGEVFDTNSRLAGAKLSGSIFLFCDLRKAQIQDTDLQDVWFIFCKMRGCNVSGSKWCVSIKPQSFHKLSTKDLFRRWIRCLG